MVVNRSRPAGVIPTLYYDDVEKAIPWLCGAFGFRERFRYGPPGDAQGAHHGAGDGTVMLGKSRVGQSPNRGDSAVLRPPEGGGMNAIAGVHVDDIDAHHERAKEFGARIVHSPETHPFGERQYTAEDLEGQRWAFSQSVADVAPEDFGAVRGEGM